MTDSAYAAVAARCYEALNDRDLDSALGHLAPDFVYDDIALGSTFRDPAAFRENLENSFATIPDFQFEVQHAPSAAGEEALEALMVSSTTKAFEVRFARS